MTVGAGAAAAAAAIRRQREEEEETMTSYTPQELAEGWEFKILRSSTSAFRKPEALRAFLAEEARAGWVLVEKFDDGRIRLKRPASARDGDAKLDFDPYRTRIGIPDWGIGLIIAGSILAAVGVIIIVIVLAVHR